jgi:hypothetical protein
MRDVPCSVQLMPQETGKHKTEQGVVVINKFTIRIANQRITIGVDESVITQFRVRRCVFVRNYLNKSQVLRREFYHNYICRFHHVKYEVKKAVCDIVDR